MMGVILAGGKCGTKDEEGALALWRTAAAKGDIWSEYRLATLKCGVGSEIDLTSAAAEDSVNLLSPRKIEMEKLLQAQVCVSVSE
jgi:hypothetical protein